LLDGDKSRSELPQPCPDLSRLMVYTVDKGWIRGGASAQFYGTSGTDGVLQHPCPVSLGFFVRDRCIALRGLCDQAKLYAGVAASSQVSPTQCSTQLLTASPNIVNESAAAAIPPLDHRIDQSGWITGGVDHVR
jgi:hypothetical protein